MPVIDEYLDKIDAPQKTELQRVRSIIKKTVPEAEEVISYGMPVFKYKGRYLVGFSPFKAHMSLFPGSGAVEALKDKLAGYTVSKGTIQFTLDHPLPEPLIKEIVLNRLADILRTL